MQSRNLLTREEVKLGYRACLKYWMVFVFADVVFAVDIFI